jgi:hypothetical protein
MSDLFGTIYPLPKARRPVEPIVRDAFVKGGCRYWLKRAWGAGPCILWAMCNPSNANHQQDDPTMWRVMEFSMRWGYGSCIVVNVVPRISPDPAIALAWLRLKETKDPEVFGDFRDQWIDNIYACRDQIAKAEAHVAAWGNSLPEQEWRDWLQEIAECTDAGKGGGMDEGDPPPVKWLCLGTTASGAPKHPLARGIHRVPDDFKPVEWKAA